jgi:hypothetical protein
MLNLENGEDELTFFKAWINPYGVCMLVKMLIIVDDPQSRLMIHNTNGSLLGIL